MATKPKNKAAAKAAPVKKPAEEAATGQTAVSEAASPAAGIPATALSAETINQVTDELYATLAAAGSDKPGDDEDAPTVTHIVVSAKVEGFRRAGRAWSKTPVTLLVETFTDEEVEALHDEPMLDIHFIAESK